jgi:hypothetical protein
VARYVARLAANNSGSLAIFARDPPRLIALSNLAADRRPGSLLEIDIRELLPVMVTHDKTGRVFLDADAGIPTKEPQ